jgi:hypothetical protein
MGKNQRVSEISLDQSYNLPERTYNSDMSQLNLIKGGKKDAIKAKSYG